MNPRIEPVVGARAPSAQQILLAERDPVSGRLGRQEKGRSQPARSRWARVGIPVAVGALVLAVAAVALAGGGGGDGDGGDGGDSGGAGGVTAGLVGTWSVRLTYGLSSNPALPTEFPETEPPPPETVEWTFEGDCDGAGSCSLTQGSRTYELVPSAAGYQATHQDAQEAGHNCGAYTTTSELDLRLGDGGFTATVVETPSTWKLGAPDGGTCYPGERTLTYRSLEKTT